MTPSLSSGFIFHQNVREFNGLGHLKGGFLMVSRKNAKAPYPQRTQPLYSLFG